MTRLKWLNWRQSRQHCRGHDMDRCLSSGYRLSIQGKVKKWNMFTAVLLWPLWPFIAHPGLSQLGIPVLSQGMAEHSRECVSSSQAGAQILHPLSCLLFGWSLEKDCGTKFIQSMSGPLAATWTQVHRLFVWLLWPHIPVRTSILLEPAYATWADCFSSAWTAWVSLALPCPSVCSGSVCMASFSFGSFLLRRLFAFVLRGPSVAAHFVTSGFTLYFASAWRTVQCGWAVPFLVSLARLKMWDLIVCNYAPWHVFSWALPAKRHVCQLFTFSQAADMYSLFLDPYLL